MKNLKLMKVLLLIPTLIISLKANAFVEQETPSFVLPEEIAVGVDKEQARSQRVREFYKAHTPFLHRVNSQLNYWNELDQWAAKWDLDESGFYSETSRIQKTEIIKSELLRYFQRQTREPLREQLNNWQVGLERDYEVDETRRINDQDSVFVYDETSYQAYLDEKTNKKTKQVSGADKKVKLTKNYKFRFKPRPFKGILITEFTNPYVNLNSVVGLNQEVEINLSKAFTKSQVYMSLHYNVTAEFILASVDKRLTENLTVRVSATQDKLNNVDFADRALVSFNFFTKF